MPRGKKNTYNLCGENSTTGSGKTWKIPHPDTYIESGKKNHESTNNQTCVYA